nr:MAG TPA: hypothetical protein [Caudoviricetes sp.]
MRVKAFRCLIHMYIFAYCKQQPKLVCVRST